MGYDINSLTIIGRLTRDPESRTVGTDGTTLCKFGLAVGHGNQEGQVNFFEAQAWKKTGELVATHLRKGSQVCIKGYLKTEEWNDKSTGERRSKTVIACDSVQFLGQPRGQQQETDHPGVYVEGNIPF